MIQTAIEGAVLLSMCQLLILSAMAQTNYFAATNHDNNVTYYCSVDGVLFDKHKLTLKQFPSDRLGTYTIPNGVMDIGDRAFAHCTNLTRVTLPDSVNNIGENAFAGCARLHDIVIPNRVRRIGGYAFGDCISLTNITIPRSVAFIGYGAFFHCVNLMSITVENNNAIYTSTDGVLFDKGQASIIQCPGGKSGCYAIPSSVTRIRNGAFVSCTSLTNIVLGTNVVSIGDAAFMNCANLFGITVPCSITNIGEDAFGFCTNLQTILVESSNAVYRSRDGVLFNKSMTDLIQYPIGNKRGDYETPATVTHVGNNAFGLCANLTNVTIGNSVSVIESGAFLECRQLARVSIGNGVSALEPFSFAGCVNLAGIFFSGDAPYAGYERLRGDVQVGRPEDVFSGSPTAIIYHLARTSDWGTTFCGRPTAIWNPETNTAAKAQSK